MQPRKMLVAGASGTAGLGVSRHFAEREDWEVLGVSRRPPEGIDGTFVALDLTDRAACDEFFREQGDITHVAYVALNEDTPDERHAENAIDRWTSEHYISTNTAMLTNVIDPLDRVAKALQHVTITEGGRAYGVHLGAMRIPGLERSPRVEHGNFYFRQEDYLKQKQAGRSWHTTVLRPRGVEGDSIAGSGNKLFAIGVYAALLREEGRPLGYPGGPPHITEMTDASLFARAIEWAATNPLARDEIFNVSNGDVFVWKNVWSTIADAMHMDVGPDEPALLAEEVPKRASLWSSLVERHKLKAPADVGEFIRPLRTADWILRSGDYAHLGHDAMVVSTIKIRLAGFQDCIDTEEYIHRSLRRFQANGLLPPA